MLRFINETEIIDRGNDYIFSTGVCSNCNSLINEKRVYDWPDKITLITPKHTENWKHCPYCGEKLGGITDEQDCY